MALIPGIFGAYSKLPESEIPLPPEWLALYLYSLLEARLRFFLAEAGITTYTTTSGYRTPAHNEAVGGSKGSAHPFGLAADIVFPGPVPAGLVKAWKDATGGFAVDEIDHVHFNLPRSWAWVVIQWGAIAIFIALMSLLIVLAPDLKGGV